MTWRTVKFTSSRFVLIEIYYRLIYMGLDLDMIDNFHYVLSLRQFILGVLDKFNGLFKESWVGTFLDFLEQNDGLNYLVLV